MVEDRTITSALTAQRLELALVQARAQATVALWPYLQQKLGVSEVALAEALWKWQGVAMITDEQWASVEPNTEAHVELDPCDGAWILWQQRPVLLSVDPWGAPSALALQRSGYKSARLALARPGQLESLAHVINAPKVVPAADRYNPIIPGSVSEGDVVSFVDAAISRAYKEGASDIHFETSRAGLQVKYRLDGVMAMGDVFSNAARHEQVISRIKVMAQLDITECRRPQDGRIHWSRAGFETIDLRVSIMPSIFGEDAVLRLLDKTQLRDSSQTISLDSLGFVLTCAQSIRGLAQRPHGMLLITGPTGSGKTTTVYAALSEVNDGLEKIITIEDPVEYELPGVLQIPVNEQKGLTFATGLRSILRHDPDKILVGEIRDAETAEIAVQSSLTGHLVFTTVHANSLFDVLGRFQHFGIEPFALASALNGVVVQRLMRKVCPCCVQWRSSTSDEKIQLQRLGLQVLDLMAVPVGCSECRGTGYKGRFVLAEVHELHDELRDLIVRRATMSEMKSTVYKNQSDRLLARAIEKVQQKVTSLEEVIRVVGLV